VSRLGIEGERDVLVLERTADEHATAAPADEAVLVDANDVVERFVLERHQRAWIPARRGGVDRRRAALPQRLVGPLVIVLASPQVKASLLRPAALTRRARSLRFERPVEAFEAAVLLRLAGGDDLDPDAEAK